MVKIFNLYVDVAGTEMLMATCDHYNNCDITFTDLDEAEQAIYNDAMAIVVNDCICNIDNTPYDIEIHRSTNVAINIVTDDITESTIDYNALSAEDKAKLDAFNDLLDAKCLE
ncbi:MAG: hypothetical protein GTN59_07555 [Candidatus Dadabacteria bacterium]|nr:hypothetical protein [Candidatus Dadabacteria bacterium]